jgi:hypothetical protein
MITPGKVRPALAIIDDSDHFYPVLSDFPEFGDDTGQIE